MVADLSVMNLGSVRDAGALPDSSMVSDGFALADMGASLLGTYDRLPVCFDRGEGVWLYELGSDVGWLDFASGIAVNILGYGHPSLVSALHRQGEKLWHISNLYENADQSRLGSRLCSLSFGDRVFFCNSGAEAIECCIKMARKYHASRGNGHRWRVMTFSGAFHGRTLAALSAGGNAAHLSGFEPAVAGFDHVPFGDIAVVRSALCEEIGAILIEPIQGEGGIRVADQSFMRALRSLCDAHDMLLIVDEVQCGMCRSGYFFAHEWSGIRPDIMALAKGLGGGFPIGACIAGEAACSGMGVGSHGSTFGGNPLAMAIGNSVLDVVGSHDFLPRVEAMGAVLHEESAGWVRDFPDLLVETRGMGLMRGVVCRIKNTDLVSGCMAEHLLVVPASDNVIRLLPPLIIEESEILEASRRMRCALSSLSS